MEFPIEISKATYELKNGIVHIHNSESRGIYPAYEDLLENCVIRLDDANRMIITGDAVEIIFNCVDRIIPPEEEDKIDRKYFSKKLCDSKPTWINRWLKIKYLPQRIHLKGWYATKERTPVCVSIDRERVIIQL